MTGSAERVPPAVARGTGDPAHGGWRLPPRSVLLAGILVIACAEAGGGAMAQFKLALARWARGVMLARPSVHGLVGVRDVDESIIDEALVKFDAGLRLFHMHAEGMGTIIILTAMVAVTALRAPALSRWIVALITIGGAGYPVGYLLWSALIPFHGIARSRAVVEWTVWIPFGGAAIAAMWLLAAALAWQMLRRRPSP